MSGYEKLSIISQRIQYFCKGEGSAIETISTYKSIRAHILRIHVNAVRYDRLPVVLAMEDKERVLCRKKDR